MTGAAPTFSQIKAHVAALRRRRPDERVVGIRSSGRWTGEARQEDHGQLYWIQQCDSPLAMRIALRQPLDEPGIKVLITPLDDKQLGDDILMRLARQQVRPINNWQIVKSLFHAQTIDPRLRPHDWIADYLLETVPDGGFPAAAAGFLDAEAVWPILLERVTGLTGSRPDLQSLLLWSLDAGHVRRLREAAPEFQAAACQWLIQMAGPTAELVLHCVLANELPDALPVGLVAGVVYHPEVQGQLERAKGHFESRYLHGTEPDETLLRRWHAAASDVVRLRLDDNKRKQDVWVRADEILHQVQAGGFAYLSDTSPLGFDQRRAQLADVLNQCLQDLSSDKVEAAAAAHQAVLAHDLSRREARCMERQEMALRLVRWLALGDDRHVERPASLALAADHYLRDGGFVDLARHNLRVPEPHRSLAESYKRLWDRVSAVREMQNRQFAELLRDWTAAGTGSGDLIPVESLLELLVAPLAAELPVLFILLDGMSVEVSRQLLADVTRQDWVPLCQEGRAGNPPALAMIPSVTTVSRTSLFCGTLMQGDHTHEQRGFEQHAALLPHCRGGFPPKVFHKVALAKVDEISLAAAVRDEIAETRRQIVAVVINAVDDHLLKGEQLDLRWTRDEIKILPDLLESAKAAGRLVVLASDHGHVLDHGSEYLDHKTSERWRESDGRPSEYELEVTGARVMLAGDHRLIAPWSENIRYSPAKRNGYHGGLTPQEMVIPISVLSAGKTLPSGWTEAPVDTPAWWERPPATTIETETVRPVVEATQPPKGLLFDKHTSQAVSPPAPSGDPAPSSAWLEALRQSPLLAAQKKIAGRKLPADDEVLRLLSVLDRGGGKLTATALARSLGTSELRLRGVLVIVQRLLNIDGYAVLSLDAASGSVELNRGLLCRQFELGDL